MIAADSTESRMSLSARNGRDDTLLLKAALGFCAISVAGFFYAIIGVDIFPLPMERPYLVPWVLATGVAIAAPLLYLKRNGQFSLMHPLVFAAASYFFPIFFVGGWSLVFGLSNHYYLSFVNDPEFDFPLTFFYIIIGFASLSVGFLLSPGRKIGKRIAKWLPSGDLTSSELFWGCLIFLALGFYATSVALEMGQLGYQTSVLGEVGSLSVYLTAIVPTSNFLLWIVFFRQRSWTSGRVVILIAQVVSAGFMFIAFGNKSSLMQAVICLFAAFVFVRGKMLFRNWVWFTSGLLIALAIGFVYGPAFRSLKGSADSISFASYVEIAVEAAASVADQSSGPASASEPLYLLADRLEIASSLAVVVSNYEELAQYEAAYGLENNIWRYTWTAFIPRFIWNDKPLIADNYAYNELYFGFREFGLAITSMGDLLRNFGPIGVPLGMLFLGFMIRIFYSSMVEDQPFSAWRSVIFFMVLTKISYDSFYGEILPTSIRVIVVVALQLVVIKMISRLLPLRQ